MARAAAIRITNRGLRLDDLAPVIEGRPVRAALTEGARGAVRRSRAVVEKILADGRSVYGVNTGVGRLAESRLPPESLDAFQVNLVRSHAAGVGAPLPEGQARLALLLRAATLARGYSGVHPETLDALVALFNAGIVPIVPSQGSVGASGDLAPLAHIALVLIGEGEATFRGERLPGGEALRRARLAPARLRPKDGLCLVNGTQVSLAVAAALALGAERLLRAADVAAATSIEALKGSAKPFQDRVQRLRPSPGQAACAANVRALLAGSGVLVSHEHCSKVQDAYSLRCVPQVHGAARDQIAGLRAVVERELAAVTDNPLVFPETGEVVSCGNFHGEALALASDAAAAALTVLASISERRVERLTNPDLSELPAFLVEGEGLQSGFMLAQVAAASLVSECKALSHPAGVDSIPTSAAKEDFVSNSLTAARKALAILANAEAVVAIEILTACQALDFLRPLRAGAGVEACHRAVRARVPRLVEDRPLSPDIEAVATLLRTGAIEAAVAREIGGVR